MNWIAAIDGASRVGLAVILNCLWQSVVIGGVAWLTLRAFARANATTRYAVWSVTLLAMVLVPVVTTLSRVSIEPSVRASAPLYAAHAGIAQREHGSVARPAQTQPATTQRAASFFASVPLRIRIPSAASAIVFGAWALGALAILVRLSVGLVQLERLKSDSLPLDIAYRDAMPRWTAAVKGERDVRICVSERVEVPVAVGLFDSMILLPSHLVHSLDPAEIDQISLHELGHLLRGDDWTNALQRIAAGLMFFSPAAWFVSRQMDVEREVACDDYVLESTGAVRPYAFCLTKMAEMTAWPHRPVPAPGVFVTRKNISIRIERLLRTGRAIGSSIAPSIAGAVTISLIAAFLALRTMTPSIAFTVPATPVLASSPRDIRPIVTPAPIVVASAIAPAIPLAIAPAVAQERARLAKVAATLARTANAMVASDGSCTGCNFDGENLAGHDFSGRSLEGSNFTGANLQRARFDHASLTGANFSGADVRGASFIAAAMEGCNLRGARLEGARFDGATLTGCDVDASHLSPEQARRFLTGCEGCDFAHADLHGMDLHGARIQGANLSGADLRDANLSGSNFEGTNFSGALLAGAKVDGANFEGCNFRGADLRGVDLSKANMTGSEMGNAQWR